MALLIASEANLLLLDEPTEGLDIAGIERLQDALGDTEAAFVLVSHDAALVEAVAERVITLEDGRLVEYRGGLEGYFRGTLRLEPDAGDASVEGDAEPEEPSEVRLVRLEDELMKLEHSLEDPFLLSERERDRLERRLSPLLDELSVLYDKPLPPPLPRFYTREGVVEVTGDGAGLSFEFSSNAGLGVRLFLEDEVGHLALHEPPDRCVLAWVRGGGTGRGGEGRV